MSCSRVPISFSFTTASEVRMIVKTIASRAKMPGTMKSRDFSSGLYQTRDLASTGGRDAGWADCRGAAFAPKAAIVAVA